MTRVKKICGRCGATAKVPQKQRKCYRLRFGKGSYACYGDLFLTERGRKERDVTKRPQDVAALKLATARAMVAKKTRALARLATSLRMWERRAQYYARQASLTDAEIAAQKAARATRSSKPNRRAMRLDAAKEVSQ